MIWYRRAAAQGSARAQYNLGVMYADALGVDPDSDEAVIWYRRAAEQGYAAAQYSLAMMYYRGDGVPQDTVLAHVWANLAASNGNANAAGVRGSIAAQLTASDIALAQRIALRCRQQGYDYCVR